MLGKFSRRLHIRPYDLPMCRSGGHLGRTTPGTQSQPPRTPQHAGERLREGRRKRVPGARSTQNAPAKRRRYTAQGSLRSAPPATRATSRAISASSSVGMTSTFTAARSVDMRRSTFASL